MPQVHAILYQLAGEVALRHATSYSWSTWHLLDYVNRNTELDATASAVDDRLWHETKPFGTCVDIALIIAKDLRAAFATIPELNQFVDNVKVMACYGKDPESGPPLHFMTAICTEEYCVILDLGFSPNAFKVMLGEAYDSMEYIMISGKSAHMRFRYVEFPDAKMITMEEIPNADGTAPLAFYEISDVAAIEHLYFRIAPRTEESIHEPGKKVPAKKYLTVVSVLHEQPTLIPFTRLDETQFVVTSCRMTVDFAKQKLTMQIPKQDWLLKPENAEHRDLLQESGIERPVVGSEAVTNLIMDLTIASLDTIMVLGDVAEKLGCPKLQYLRIVESIRKYGSSTLRYVKVPA